MKKCNQTDCNGACKATGKPCPFEKLSDAIKHKSKTRGLELPDPLIAYINKPDQGNSPAVIVYLLGALLWLLITALLLVGCGSTTLTELDAVKRAVDGRGTYVDEKRFVPLADATGQPFKGNCSRYAQEYRKALTDAGHTGIFTRWNDDHMWTEVSIGGQSYALDNRCSFVVRAENRSRC
jgi:hypothetical protein